MAEVIAAGNNRVNSVNVRTAPESAVNTFSTQNVNPADVTFLEFLTNGEGDSDSDPYDPGSQVFLVENLAVNDGGVSGTFTMEFAELDQSGDVVESICRETAAVDAGEQFALSRAGGDCQIITGTDVGWEVQHTVSGVAGDTQFWGMKAWEFREGEPPFSLAFENQQNQVTQDVDEQDIIQQQFEDVVIPASVGIATGTVAGILSSELSEML